LSQTRTISILASTPLTTLGPLTATFACDSLVSATDWSLQFNSLSLRNWVQSVLMVEYPTDTLPDMTSFSVGAAGAEVTQYPGVDTWNVVPTGSPSSQDGVSNGVSRAQIESGEVSAQLILDGGLDPPYPTGAVGQMTFNLVETSTGAALYQVQDYLAYLPYMLAVEMVGYGSSSSSIANASFTSGTASCAFSGQGFTPMVGDYVQYGTYTNGWPLYWNDATGETSNMSQYIASWTPTLVRTGYVTGTPPPDATEGSGGTTTPTTLTLVVEQA
jgi:hypothetical protein